MKREPRQRNVQQQNERTRRAIRASAEYWRHHPVPGALVACAEAQGIHLERGIILGLEIDFPGMPSLFGTLLTEAGRFISFEIDLDAGHIEVQEWRDVTDQQNLRRHNRGIGIGEGALALDILAELNARPLEPTA